MIYAKGKAISWLLLVLTVAVLTVSLSSPCFGESEKGKGEKTKKKISKEEAFAYIKERCTIDNNNAETKDDVFLEGCMLITQTKGYGGTAGYMHRRYAPLNKLNPESPNNGIWPSTNGIKYGLIANSVSYSTADEEPHIKFVVERTQDNYTKEQELNYGFFQCETETKAKQAAKALKYLIKLCGGSNPKDLFDDVIDDKKKGNVKKDEFD
ncbi:MAG: hypothetical protein HQK99_04485 [Nitrospirae bacterium]|nr:hypothetical protein [Nitrospirota bacterium]